MCVLNFRIALNRSCLVISKKGAFFFSDRKTVNEI